RRRLKNRQVMLSGDFTDAQGHVIGALGDYARRAVFFFLVRQRHREVAGAGDDHIGLGHLAHHAAAVAGLLYLADLGFYVGVAIGVLVFLALLLFGHAQVLCVGP